MCAAAPGVRARADGVQRLRTYGLAIEPGPRTEAWMVKMWSAPVVRLFEDAVEAEERLPERVRPEQSGCGKLVSHDVRGASVSTMV